MPACGNKNRTGTEIIDKKPPCKQFCAHGGICPRHLLCLKAKRKSRLLKYRQVSKTLLIQLHQPQLPHQPLNDDLLHTLQDEHEPKPEREFPQPLQQQLHELQPFDELSAYCAA